MVPLFSRECIPVVRRRGRPKKLPVHLSEHERDELLLLLGHPPRDQHQHLDLAGGERARVAGLTAHSMPACVQHGPDRVAVQATVGHLCFEHLPGRVPRPRGAGRGSSSAWYTSAAAITRAVIGRLSAVGPDG